MIFAGLALAYSKRETKKYTATAAIAFASNSLSQQITGLSANNGSTVVAQQDSDLELVRLGSAAAKTAATLGRGLTAESVSESVTVGVKGETDVVYVAATDASPLLASEIANTYVKAFVQEQQASDSAFLKTALAQVQKQLAELSPAERFGGDAVDLQQRAHTLRFLQGVGYHTAQLAGEAGVPTSPSSPKTKRNTLLGILLGLIVGLILAFLLERLDRRIREPEKLEAIYRLPLLGVVPSSSALLASARRIAGGSELPSTEAEAFNLIRAHLRFFNVDRDLRAVLVASPSPQDGKTTVALNLAEAAARSGTRTLLLEADLRMPTLAQHLDIPSGPGLADVLIGAVSIQVATQVVELKVAHGTGSRGHRLDVLTAGQVLPPNPGELLESRALATLLENVKASYELVVIDTPPLTAVSDAFPLLTRVDGVVIVGRIGKSRKDDAEELERVLAGSGAPLLGVIANDSKVGAPAPYGADKGRTTTAPISADTSESSDTAQRSSVAS